MKTFRYLFKWLQYLFLFAGLWALDYLLVELPFEQSRKVLFQAAIFGLVLSTAIILPRWYRNHKGGKK